MHARISGKAYYCPDCSWQTLSPIVTEAPFHVVVDLDPDKYEENLGDHTYRIDTTVSNARKEHYCGNCLDYFNHMAERNPPEVLPVWECGECGQTYFGYTAQQEAVRCCT